MFGKWAQAALVAVLVVLAYLFTLNPGQVDFRLSPGASVRASLALLLLLTFVAGFGVAFLLGAFREAFQSFSFWRRLRGHQRRSEAHRLLELGRSEAVAGRARAAAQLFRKAHRKLPEEGAIGLELARAECREGDFASAEKRLSALLADDPGNAEVHAALLDTAKRQGDDDAQRSVLTRWLGADPEFLPALRELRDLNRRLGRWAEALELQEKILARTRGKGAVAGEKRALAECLFRSAKDRPPADAQAALKRAIEADRDFAPAYAALGDALLASGDDRGAADAWLQGYRETGRAGLLLKLEGFRTRRGEAEEMLAFYRKQGRKDRAAALLRARLLVSLNRPEEALQAVQEAPEAASSALGRWLEGEASFRLRAYDGAARSFRRSLDAEDGPPPLAFACRSCGRSARAWSEACSSCGAFDTLELQPGQLPPSAG
ncbi:MAG: tetratricopeptide repeat protein [Deltaproteobacteria bacterium]|nr:tetratricopeptide repeat protein [Deltaproteobacteria bacterium]